MTTPSNKVSVWKNLSPQHSNLSDISNLPSPDSSSSTTPSTPLPPLSIGGHPFQIDHALKNFVSFPDLNSLDPSLRSDICELINLDVDQIETVKIMDSKDNGRIILLHYLVPNSKNRHVRGIIIDTCPEEVKDPVSCKDEVCLVETAQKLINMSILDQIKKTVRKPVILCPTFPFTEDVEIDDDRIRNYKFTDQTLVTDAKEGTVLRVWYDSYSNTWNLSTFRKLDG